jgi:hypothetical protein
MAGRSKEQHQPEPWKSEGRGILNAAGWTLAKTIFEADARRIVAAVNDVLGIPTAALEAGFIREIRCRSRARRWIQRSSSSTTAGSSSGAVGTAGAPNAVAESRPLPGSSRSPISGRPSGPPAGGASPAPTTTGAMAVSLRR